MKFFLPAAKSVEDAEQTYEVIRRFVEKQCGALSDTRYRQITFMRRGKAATATVGQIEPLIGETVVAIFRAAGGQSLHFICTPNRGALDGLPLYEGQVLHAEEFE